ncbi:MAG: uL15 family ribosomal protein [Nanoarchaeota archaeon]|nr:uL15 family ribosomal protein [Nanoarchaeota archaeon]MBU1622653.1 uL15 family ribosomal protein [Nanoarchaeota archaeon]MBU1974232.1 uL15 family ribosomal protein [Nanoarchaeota archaeon]
MVVHKQKKVTKYRGHTTHGGGHRKKRRGAGSRGGRGRAGTGKRASQKKAGLPPQLGSKGFHSHRRSGRLKTINVADLAKLADNGVVDLKKLGYDKLLGAGKISVKLTVQVVNYSARAEEKIKAAGGEIVAVEPAKEVKETEKKSVPKKEKEEQVEEITESQSSEKKEDKEETN